MKSNPHVYPSIDFEELSNKNLRNNFIQEKIVSINDIADFLENRILIPIPQITGTSIEEKILSIFQDENYRFGPVEFINSNIKKWIERISYFTSKNLPIQFTILGFPFKIPVPLKTNRIFPDMGEVLALHRLSVITKLITNIYKNGARITLFTEGGFGPFTGVPKANWIAYRVFLEELNSQLKLSKSVNIIDLSEMEKTVPDFLEKYNSVFPVIYKIVFTTDNEEKILMDVYNTKLSDDEISPKASEIKNSLKEKTHKCIFSYFAYLKVRDDIDYLQKTVPHSLPLSVSPKFNRLGIIPIRKDIDKLPYHSVPVLSNNNTFDLKYLIDLKRSFGKFTKVFLDIDKEKKPFYYEKIK